MIHLINRTTDESLIKAINDSLPLTDYSGFRSNKLGDLVFDSLDRTSSQTNTKVGDDIAKFGLFLAATHSLFTAPSANQKNYTNSSNPSSLSGNRPPIVLTLKPFSGLYEWCMRFQIKNNRSFVMNNILTMWKSIFKYRIFR
jgi:hypothetical protein